jgi:hypothetical protein
MRTRGLLAAVACVLAACGSAVITTAILTAAWPRLQLLMALFPTGLNVPWTVAVRRPAVLHLKRPLLAFPSPAAARRIAAFCPAIAQFVQATCRPVVTG